MKNSGLVEARHQGLVSLDHVVLKNQADGVIKADGHDSEIDFATSS